MITSGSGSTTMAAISVRRMIGRCAKPESASPRSKASTAAWRSSGAERISWRIATTSLPGISLRAQWMAPRPMSRMPRPRLSPSARFSAPTGPEERHVRPRHRPG